MKVLFVTTHNLATNPRLVKEVEFALDLGHSVTIVCFVFNNWSSLVNQEIKTRFGNCHFIELNVSRKSFAWIISTLAQKMAKYGLRIFPKRTDWQSFFLDKKSFLLDRCLRTVDTRFDLLIAHNPGSFYPVFKFSERNDTRYGIDLEDYHPGETNDPFRSKFSRGLIDKVIEKSAWVTAASPLILEQTLKDTRIKPTATATVLNYFPLQEFKAPPNLHVGKLRLVWFSQYIAEGRGLEYLVPLIKKYTEEVELHLYGSIVKSFSDKWFLGSSNIFVHGPESQSILHQKLSNYDIGVALEDSKSNQNRDLCITNKILAYYQAGLYIVATNTQAQSEFIGRKPGHGILGSLTQNDLQKTINLLLASKEQIRSRMWERYQMAKDFAWENERRKLQPLWSKN